jgi:hypothetical protein
MWGRREVVGRRVPGRRNLRDIHGPAHRHETHTHTREQATQQQRAEPLRRSYQRVPACGGRLAHLRVKVPA